MISLNCRGRMVVSEQPMVMGIINATPDSFYAGSRQTDTNAVLKKVEQMVSEGADIIDIGAQSTRPHSTLISVEEELSRLTPVVSTIAKHFPSVIISIDTFYSRVARSCVEAGATMINDISGGGMDAEMLETVASLHVPYVCMHMRGTPQNMHEHTDYDDLTISVLDYFIRKMEDCRKAGIMDLIVDPGFGFSKTISQNFELLKNLHALTITGKPILVGISRKSTVYKTLGVSVEDALNGTTALNTVALLKGAGILRVHDVKEARQCVTLMQYIQ